MLVPSTDTGLDYETIPPPVDLLDLDLAMDSLAQETRRSPPSSRCATRRRQRYRTLLTSGYTLENSSLRDFSVAAIGNLSRVPCDTL